VKGVGIDDVSNLEILESYFKDMNKNKPCIIFIKSISKEATDMELFINSLNKEQRSHLFTSLIHHLRSE
jgi:hypothetical protein